MKCTCGCMKLFLIVKMCMTEPLYSTYHIKNSVVLFIILNKTTIKIDKYDAKNLCKQG